MRPDDVRDAVRESVEHARQALSAGSGPALAEDSVHAARKDFKRVRAYLRLLRDALGRAAYRRENLRMRDAARRLAGVRDAKVTIATLGRLREDGLAAECRPLLAKLARTARADQRHEHELLERGEAVASDLRALADTARQLDDWRLPERLNPVLRAGLRRIYRKGREALKAARREPSTATLHELRKRTKYLAEALAAVGKGARARGARKAAEALCDRLGDDHDLALVEARIAGARAPASKDQRTLLGQLRDRRERIQGKAMKKSRRLYRAPAGEFVRQLRAP